MCFPHDCIDSSTHTVIKDSMAFDFALEPVVVIIDKDLSLNQQ